MTPSRNVSTPPRWQRDGLRLKRVQDFVQAQVTLAGRMPAH